MGNFLKKKVILLFWTFFLLSNKLNAMNILDITETPNELLVESKIKYPKKVFNAEDFIKEVDNKLEKKTVVELDLSNDASLNYRDIRKIVNYFNKNNVKINFINLSNTNMDENVLSSYNNLISNPDFKYLDISNTPAVETEEDFSKNEKIIFIGKNMLENSRKKLEKVFGQDVINRHINYYEKTETFAERRKNLKD